MRELSPVPGRPRTRLEICGAKGIGTLKIIQVRVAFLGFAIPSKHGVDCFRQLSTAGFINAACVYPELLKVIFSCLFPTEQDLIITSLAFA